MALPFRMIYSPDYEVNIGSHVFPTRKYRLIRERLLKEGVATEEDLLLPPPADDREVLLVHTPEYVEKLKVGRLSWEEVVRLEVPCSPELVRASWICAGGSTLAGREALARGVSVHLGGGFHHAFPEHGEGFCVLNDVAVAIRVLFEEGTIHRAGVIDCDVHQGNGTAAIFRDDPRVYTFSIHQENTYPSPKPPSTVDIGLEDGAGDQEFIAALERELPRIVDGFKPDLVFYLAGADPYEEDQLGGLRLTLEGLLARDRLVLQACRKARVPVAITLAGGYAQRPEDTVTIHANTVKVAAEVFARG